MESKQTYYPQCTVFGYHVFQRWHKRILRLGEGITQELFYVVFVHRLKISHIITIFITIIKISALQWICEAFQSWSPQEGERPGNGNGRGRDSTIFIHCHPLTKHCQPWPNIATPGPKLAIPLTKHCQPWPNIAILNIKHCQPLTWDQILPTWDQNSPFWDPDFPFSIPIFRCRRLKYSKEVIQNSSALIGTYLSLSNLQYDVKSLIEVDIELSLRGKI